MPITGCETHVIVSNGNVHEMVNAKIVNCYPLICVIVTKYTEKTV